jgi:hypothetical protein
MLVQHLNSIHGRRGLMPTYNEAGMAFGMVGEFNRYQSYPEFWDLAKPGFMPDFVAWVDEQRATGQTDTLVVSR